MADLPVKWHGMAPNGTESGQDLVTSLIGKSALKTFGPPKDWIAPHCTVI